MKRLDATLIAYDGGKNGYCLRWSGGGFETDTAVEALRLAHLEGVTRVFSARGNYVITNREDV